MCLRDIRLFLLLIIQLAWMEQVLIIFRTVIIG